MLKIIIVFVILIIIKSAYAYNYSKDIYYIKQQTKKNFYVSEFLSINGYSIDSKDQYYNKIDWDNQVIGYLPILGRVPNIGIHLEYLGKDQIEINTNNGYIIPLQPRYSSYFFKLIENNPAIDHLIYSNYYILIFNSDPGSSDNSNYFYNNNNPCENDFTAYIDIQINSLSYKQDTFNLIKASYTNYKILIRNENKKNINCITSQLAIYLLPKQYFK